MAAAGMPPSRRAERKGRSILRARNEHNAKFMTDEEQVTVIRRKSSLAHISRAARRISLTEGEYRSQRLYR